MRNPYERGLLLMPSLGSEGQGASIVLAGGPGTNLGRLPIYTLVGPTSGGVYTPQEIVDTNGNLISLGQLVPVYIDKDFIQADATIPATQTVMIAPEPLQLVSINCRFSHVGGSSAALSFAKDPTGTAPGGGTGLVTATIDLTGGTVAVNTNYPASLSGTVANLQFAAGDGFSLVFSGTLTGLTGLVVSARFERIRQTAY